MLNMDVLSHSKLGLARDVLSSEVIKRQRFVSESAIIGPNVKIGSGNWIGPHVSLSGPVNIGDNNAFLTGVCIGQPPRQLLQNSNILQVFGAAHGIEIGSSNIFYEYVTIHLPLQRKTSVGSFNSIGTRCHIAHDVVIMDKVTTAAGCNFGGYITILSYANIGLGVSIHPRLVLGQYCMCGMGSVVLENIRPAEKIAGAPARHLGINALGLMRAGISRQVIEELTAWIRHETSPTSDEALNAVNMYFEAIQGIDLLERSADSRGGL
jgi:UDP-N-acetylglucosamine acyltransferase